MDLATLLVATSTQAGWQHKHNRSDGQSSASFHAGRATQPVLVRSAPMARRSLRPHLNQIRGWVRQGRTDAWIAHQLEATVQQIETFKRDNDLLPAETENGEAPGLDFDDEIDLRAEDDALVAAELEAAEARRLEEEAAEAARKAEEEARRAEAGEDEEAEEEAAKPAPRRRGR